MFKPGDKVMCIDSQHTDLVNGRTYTVMGIHKDSNYEDRIDLQEIGERNSWFASRFISACGLAKVLYSIGDDSDV